MKTLAVTFTNFGPYHLARLRALAIALRDRGENLIAYEVAGHEARYPWLPRRGDEPFRWTTFFPGRTLERLSSLRSSRAMIAALDRDRPDALAIVGYSRPESTAALAWANRRSIPVILMSETQKIDHPRVWWKEAVKSRRVRKCSGAVVGGPRHRDYLVELGMPADRVFLGYNAVDHAYFASNVARLRLDARSRQNLPRRHFFLAVNRFVPEKNLVKLIRAYDCYRRQTPSERAWDLVLSGDGPDRPRIEAAIAATRYADSIRLPGFLQTDELCPYLAHASAFVHPSLMEPWGLVVNEAASSGLPLIVSERAGCVETFVPHPPGTTGLRFDPADEESLAEALATLASLPEGEREAIGLRAQKLASEWGPDRFAQAVLEALESASKTSKRRLGRTLQGCLP